MTDIFGVSVLAVSFLADSLFLLQSPKGSLHVPPLEKHWSRAMVPRLLGVNAHHSRNQKFSHTTTFLGNDYGTSLTHYQNNI